MNRPNSARSPRRAIAGVIAFAATAALLAGCAASGGDATTSGDSDIAIPAALAEKGVLTIGTSPIIGLPWTALDESTSANIGIDPEMGALIAEQLGLKVEFVDLGFDSLIPSLEAGRIDVIMSDMLDTPARQEVIDFVDYINGGDGMLVNASRDLNPATVDELCGLTVGALRGAAAHETLMGVECAAGNEIDIQLFPDTGAELIALTANRLDVAMGDPSTWGYLAAQQPEDYRSVGEIFNVGPLGIGVVKDSALVAAVKEALTRIIADGSYGKVLDGYGMPSDAHLAKATVNGKKD